MEFLKELFAEPLSYEAFSKAVTAKGIKLADLSKGEYVSKAKFEKADTDLKTANQTITDMTSEMQKLKDSGAAAADWEKKFNDLKTEIADKEQKEKAEREDKELTDAITAVFGDKKFTSDYVRNGIITDMKTEIAKPENKGKGYGELFDALTKDKEGIFASTNPAGGKMSGMSGGGQEELTDDEIKAIMGIK